MTGHFLKQLQHIFLFYKRHLAVDLCELRLTVSTKVLITETLGNLEVTVETGHHQQLLQRLRRLRQGIELSRIHTTGYHEVTGTLWRGTDQNRCLHLNEVLAIEEIANQDGHTMAQFEILTNSLTAQIEITILHTDIIAAIGIILNGERRCQTLAQHIQFLYQNLNITRRHLGILALTLANLTFHLNTELTTQFVGLFTKGCIISLVEHQLSQAISVTEVHEGHTSHLTTTLYPSGQCHNTAGI